MTRSLALVLAALAAAAGGCRRGPPPVHVPAVRVAEGASDAPLREAGLDAATAERAARDALAAAGFVLGEGDRAHRARLEVVQVRLAPPRGTGGVRVEVAAELELSPVGTDDAGTRRETGVGTAPLAPGKPQAEAWGEALRAATADAATSLALGFAAEAKSTEQLLADLKAADPRVRDHAMSTLADRKSPAAVPALLEKLKDPDVDVVHRAVGALAQIRDQRAVDPLIEISRRGDGAFTARIARIVGDIGGAEAEGYLLTLESGHPDPRVRRAAGEALAELQARNARAAPVAAGKR